MKALSIIEIARAIGAKTALSGIVTSICTDSRKLSEGCLFIALSGESFDGHQFTQAALEQGAVAVLVERETGCGEKELMVDDTHLALLNLAAYYRRLFDVEVIAITGSVGKTTTKEMTAAVISKKFNTLKNEGNRNNEIGLPMTIFNLNESYKAAVLEMGMSAPGEISCLSKTSAPAIAILTNIGVSHMERLGSRENILKAKFEILDGMCEDAPLIINGDDALLFNTKTNKHRVIYYGIDNEACQVKACNIVQANNETSFTLVYGTLEQPILLPTIGKHNIYNALAAFAAGTLMGVEPEAAAAALFEYVPSGMRQRIKSINGITFIEDCYNASPDSQRAALSVLAGIKSNRKIAVLGDMLELGAISEQAHMDVGACAAKEGVDVLLAYGERSKLTAQKAGEMGVKTVYCFYDKKELARCLNSILTTGDGVLFKASRGMGLEDVIKIVYEELKTDE